MQAAADLLPCDVRATVLLRTRQGHCITMSRWSGKYDVTDGVQCVDPQEDHTFLLPLSP